MLKRVFFRKLLYLYILLPILVGFSIFRLFVEPNHNNLSSNIKVEGINVEYLHLSNNSYKFIGGKRIDVSSIQKSKDGNLKATGYSNIIPVYFRQSYLFKPVDKIKVENALTSDNYYVISKKITTLRNQTSSTLQLASVKKSVLKKLNLEPEKTVIIDSPLDGIKTDSIIHLDGNLVSTVANPTFVNEYSVNDSSFYEVSRVKNNYDVIVFVVANLFFLLSIISVCVEVLMQGVITIRGVKPLASLMKVKEKVLERSVMPVISIANSIIYIRCIDYILYSMLGHQVSHVVIEIASSIAWCVLVYACSKRILNLIRNSEKKMKISIHGDELSNCQELN